MTMSMELTQWRKIKLLIDSDFKFNLAIVNNDSTSPVKIAGTIFIRLLVK